MTEKPYCPFCGTDKLKFFARIAGGYSRHYIGQFHCLKCGARSPHVNSRKMDYREHLTQAEEMELQKQAYRKHLKNNIAKMVFGKDTNVPINAPDMNVGKMEG
jgi:hypothetical protein